MKKILMIITGILLLAGLAHAQPEKSVEIPESVTLFKNVKVFNGTENKLHDVDVLVVKNKIHKIAENLPTTGSYEIDVSTGVSRQVFPSLPGALHSSSEYTIYQADEKN